MPYNRVNPPKQLQLPPEIQANVQLKRAFDDRDYIIFQMWQRLGAGEDFVDDNQTNTNEAVTLSKLFDIRQQIGSNKPVTIDTTGFTIDTTEQTTDKTEV
jgi:hypothetical protein